MSMEEILGRLFRKQVDRLIAAGFPGTIHLDDDGFRERLEPLNGCLAKAAEHVRGNHQRFPFIIMPGWYVSPTIHMALIHRKNGAGGIGYHIGGLQDREGNGNPNPYLLVDVEPGREMDGMAPEESGKRFREAGRLPLSLPEGIVLAILHPEQLDEGAIDCFGSTCGPFQIPSIGIRREQPFLLCSDVRIQLIGHGAASCAARIGI